MLSEQKLRSHIRNLLNEMVNNFLEKEKETTTKQLKDDSKSQVIGDPISDVSMNQMVNELGSDGKNAPTVSVKAGATKGGSNFNAGQHQANFSNKTIQAK